MAKKKGQSSEKSVLTNAQFAELKRLLQTYVRITAIGAIREMSDSEMARNTWLLNEAGYSQRDIAKILRTSAMTVNRILAGKPAIREGEQEETK
jgi:DNA-binding transcriptional regulator LsrR (DeoR family)